MTKVATCSIGETGKASGNTAGDSTGKEWYVRDWYDGNWTAVFRHPDSKVADMIGTMAKAAAENDKCGYDQGDRLTFYNQLSKVDWKPSKITAKCEADCSSSTAAIVIGAGKRCNNSKCASINKSMTTSNEKSVLSSAGFKVLTDSKYLNDSSYLKKGDILLKSGHTVIVVTDGSKVTSSTSSSSTSSTTSTSTSTSTSYSTGTYKTIVANLNVRTGAGTNYSTKSKSQLTSDGQKHSNSKGQLVKGTTVTVSKVTKKTNGNVWGQIPSGWIALYYNGTAYVKKA